jgi:hypothetical protein
VDDCKLSHEDPDVVSNIIEWFKSKFGELGKLKVSRGNKHKFLGINLKFVKGDKVLVNMKPYVADMVDSSPTPITKVAATPATCNLFKVNEDSPLLDEKQASIFHTIIAKGLFLCKRARPDILTTIAFLTMHVKEPTHEDWSKLNRMLEYLHGTRNMVISLRADGCNILKWYVDVAHQVHPDLQSHTGSTMNMGAGGIINNSTKQKLNTRSSTESELVGVDDIMPQILWTNNFLKEQGYNVTDTILYQDNKSAILLEKNGRLSSSKRTKHIEARYFFIKDCQDRGKLTVQFCPTENMVADFFSKPLQGKQFRKF